MRGCKCWDAGLSPIVWRSCLSPPLDSRFRENDEVGGRNDGRDAANDDERLLGRSIPDRSPGHAFVPIAHPGWRRHTKV